MLAYLKKPPPVWVDLDKNRYKEILNEIRDLTNKNIKFNILEKIGVVKVTTNENYIDAIKDFLGKNNISFYSIKPKASRPKKFIIKGLSSDFPINDIIDFYSTQGITLNQCCQLRSFKKDRKLLPIFLISIDSNPDNVNHFKSITHINQVNIYIEAHRSRGFKQCYRCQRLFHSSLCCTMTPRCVKCGLDHWSRDCLKLKDSPARCCNCNGEHPANYSGCPANPINKRTAMNGKAHDNNNPQSKVGNVHPSALPMARASPSKNNRSWANIVQNADNTQINDKSTNSSPPLSSNNSENSSAFPIAEILNLITKPEFLLILSKINDIINIFNSNLSTTDKFMKISSLFISQP